MRKIYFLSVALISGALLGNVSAQSVTVANGGFETGIADGWGKAANDDGKATYEEVATGAQEGTKALKVKVDALGKNSWSIQISNDKWVVKKDKTYVLSMWMKDISEGTDTMKVNFTAGMTDGSSAWNEGIRLNKVALTKTWAKYTVYFSPKSEDLDKSFYAYMATHFVSKGIALVDNFTVTETQIKSASVSADGKKVKIEFLQNLNAPNADNKANFFVKVAGAANAVTAITQSATELNKIELTLTTPVVAGAAVTVAYIPGTLSTTANVELTQFATEVTNNVSNQPVVVSAVVNGGFEAGIVNGWNKASNDDGKATYEEVTTGAQEGTKALKVKVDVLGKNSWSIQISNDKWSVEKGKTYTLSMWMKDISEGTDTAKVNFTAGLTDGSSAWNEGIRLDKVALTKEWKKYTVDFSPKSDDLDKSYYAYMATHFVSKGIALIDNFTVAEKQSNVSLLSKSVTNVSVYPNPATDVVCIKGASDIVAIEIVDLSGKLVRSEKCSGTFDVSSLRSGLYFVKAVNTKGEAFVSKLSVK